MQIKIQLSLKTMPAILMKRSSKKIINILGRCSQNNLKRRMNDAKYYMQLYPDHVTWYNIDDNIIRVNNACIFTYKQTKCICMFMSKYIKKLISRGSKGSSIISDWFAYYIFHCPFLLFFRVSTVSPHDYNIISIKHYTQKNDSLNTINLRCCSEPTCYVLWAQFF